MKDTVKEDLKIPSSVDWQMTRSEEKIKGMNQITLRLDPLHKKTRKEVFLEEMDKVVPRQASVALIQSLARGAHQALGGRPPF